MSALHPLPSGGAPAAVPACSRLHSAILRVFQVIGTLIALAAAGLAAMWALEGRGGDAVLAAGRALFPGACVFLAGWMRRWSQAQAEMFPPDLR